MQTHFFEENNVTAFRTVISPLEATPVFSTDALKLTFLSKMLLIRMFKEACLSSCRVSLRTLASTQELPARSTLSARAVQVFYMLPDHPCIYMYMYHLRESKSAPPSRSLYCTGEQVRQSALNSLHLPIPWLARK